MEVKDSSYIAFPDFLFIISSAQECQRHAVSSQ